MGGRLGRLLLGSHADGSRKMYEVHVSGFAISSDKSPECELTGSSKRKFKREMDCYVVLIDVGINRNQT